MLLETLNRDKIKFMKDKNTQALSVVRMILSESKNKEIDLQRGLTDEDVLAVISTMVKKVEESLSYAVKSNDVNRITEHTNELEILKGYLPKAMTVDEINALAIKLIADNGFTGKKDMGKVMQLIRPLTVGRADGKLVSQIVTQLLS